MTVKDVPGGDVVFFSHNGGDWRAVKDECRRLGLLPPLARANDNCDRGERETGCYEYVGADGVIAYRTVRKERAGQRKRFVAQRPDGRGGWINGLGDTSRILYRLPDIKAAVSRSALKDEPLPLVYLVEGERKADKLARWGFVATAVAFGSKGWRDSYAADLAGCSVAILPDNDDVGRAFADKAAASIQRAGGVPVIVALPDLPEAGDIIDWEGTADDLRQLTAAALTTPPEPAETFPIADLAAWAEVEPTPKAFTMAGVIPSNEVTLFTGPGGTNKSTFGLQLCACSSAGLPMLGSAVVSGSALYVTAEDEDRENHWRLRKIAGAIGTTLSALAGRLHVVSLRGRLNNELATFDGEGRLHVAPAYQLLRSTIEVTKSKLIVLDNLGHLFIGNENDRGQVTAFINLLYQLCRELGVTIVLIGHPNKAGDSYSGSTAWLNAVRSQIVLTKPENSFDPDARVLSLGKANYARPDQHIAFRWHDFALILDSDLPGDQRKQIAATAQAGSDNAVFLACLAERNRQHRQVSDKPTAANFAPRQFEKMREAKGLSKERLAAAMDRLFAIDAIERGYLWRDTAEGKDIHGLRAVDGGDREVPETSPETSRKQYPDGSGNPQRTTGNTVPYTTYNPGAAHRAAAPVTRGLDMSERDPADEQFGASA